MLKTAITRRLGLLGVSLATLALSPGVRAEDANDPVKTASPIKHVIIIVGENRSFDHLFATYMPKSRDERVLNLLSEGIVKPDGTPDEKFNGAHQFQITSAPNGESFFISAKSANKTLYSTLPAPDLAGVQNPPAAGSRTARCRPVPVRNRRHRAAKHGRSGYSHHQRQDLAARPIPDDRPDHAL
jgi:phospholipase C